MKLAIMQPYFFPYIGYFSLIEKSDEFIIFDTPQFMRKGWIERNRIIKEGGGSSYVKVPLIKSALGTSINHMKVDNSSDWKNKIIAQLNVYKKKAPYFNEVLELVNDSLSGDFKSISELNEQVIRKISNYLGITTNILVFSEMKLEIEPVNAPDEWALNICRSLGAEHYINAAGGRSFFDETKYAAKGVELEFIDQPLPEYKQLNQVFEPGLSIIDVMMFNSKEAILEMISKSTLQLASKNY